MNNRTAINLSIRLAFFSVLAIASTGLGLQRYSKTHDQIGDQSISKLIPVVEEAKRVNGSYPTALTVPPVKVWSIFPGPQVVYRSDGAQCDIYYYQWPLGPHHGFKCSTKEWYFEE